MTPVIALIATGLGLLAATAATARRPSAPIPDLDGYRRRWAALHGGYDPRANAWLHGWLRLTYRLARPLARAGVSPDILTLWGAWFAFAVFVPAQAGQRWPLLAGLLVVVSGWSDTLDGCVAALTDRASRWGYVLDSVVDRVVDAVHLLAVWSVGGPAWLALVAGACGFLQEYTRARAGNAGMGEVGVVTVGERATRVIVTALALLLGGVLVGRAAAMATLGLAVLAALSVISLGQVLVYVRRRLGTGAAAAGEG